MLIIRNCALFSGGWSRINESEMKSATLPNMIAINLTKIQIEIERTIPPVRQSFCLIVH